ncbi:MAG: P1 family peptidase [candidate division KSB1 bacterium]|nr:P1 family peptidase [candidate division KSB1 bacterium]MDZ7309921.1 P1 family peptidase [candidate division KSB1 bacterium]
MVLLGLATALSADDEDHPRRRARDFGVEIGILKPGDRNSITDVQGVLVGHATLCRGDSVRTGVTAILPHNGNLFQEKVPAAVFVGNGFGKLIGVTQIHELGNLESPILLTNTLNVPRVADALIDYMLSLPGNQQVRSINVVVGETNDGFLNDIRGRHVGKAEVFAALESAKAGSVEEGCVGAGTGTVCFGWKGGIGTSSRVLPKSAGDYTVGVLVQSNFGGVLTINGAPVGRELGRFALKEALPYSDGEGSCMIVIATDAPLEARNLKRLAARAMLGLARTGGYCANGSGDYAIAFSTTTENRIAHSPPDRVQLLRSLVNDETSPLFLAVVEATEEAIINSLFMATTTRGIAGHVVEALPLARTLQILKKYNALHHNRDLPSWKK